MGLQIVKQRKVWVGSYEFSNRLSAAGLDLGANMQDSTSLADVTEINLAGLKTAGFAYEGFWDATPDSEFFANLSLADVAATLSADTGAEGEDAFSIKAAHAAYSPGGSVGDTFKFSVSGKGNAFYKGTILLNAAKTASASGTARQLGAVSAAQTLYASMHVTTVSGTSPTLDVVIQSDTASGFTSPVSRITFTQATGITSEWKELAGAITDDWYRVDFTIGGTSPSFDFIVNVGIL